MEKEDFLENKIFILHSCVIIDFRLFDLYKERKLLENKLSEAKELLGHNHNNLVLVWLK